MNLKWDMPPHVTFWFCSNQYLLGIRTPQCSLFTGRNCCWPKPCAAFHRTIHLQGYVLAWLPAFTKVSELPLWDASFLSLQKWASDILPSSGSLVANDPLEWDVSPISSCGLVQKQTNKKTTHKNQQDLLSSLWDFSPLQDTNFSAKIFINSEMSVPHFAHAPTFLTCNAHRWQQPTDSCRVKPHCICQRREHHPEDEA